MKQTMKIKHHRHNKIVFLMLTSMMICVLVFGINILVTRAVEPQHITETVAIQPNVNASLPIEKTSVLISNYDLLSNTVSDTPTFENIIYAQSSEEEATTEVTTEATTEVTTEATTEVTTEATTIEEDEPDEPEVNGPMEYHLTAYLGVFDGPSGRETYYNLNMDKVIEYMRELDFSEEDYPYWIRDDGCKMFGPYIIVAANLNTRPKGTILETSLGTAIVCDTGKFVNEYPDGIDIAVNW